MYNQDENPTQDWAWNEEGWSPVRLNLDQQRDYRYQYNPAVHPLYSDVLQEQNIGRQTQ